MESSLIYHMGYVKAHVAFNRKRIFYSTNVKIAKDFIDNKCFVKAKAHPNFQNLNQQILISKQRLDDVILKDIQNYGTIDIDRIKNVLANPIKPINAKENTIEKNQVKFSISLSQFLNSQPKMHIGLKKQYESLHDIIVKNDCTCQDITLLYLQQRLNEFRLNKNANTANIRFKNFKRFIKWCHDCEYPLPKMEWKRFSEATFKPDFAYLTEERIQQLIEFNPSSKIERKVRDIFLVLIYTGIRYSDYTTLSQSEIECDHIDKVARKNKIRFKVPIHTVINGIVNLPPKVSCQTFNKWVKVIGAKLNWNESVRFRTDLDEFITIPFYEMLCSSVGRHTFATRALLNGVPHNIIMGWCGWCSSSLLFYYSERLNLHTTSWMEKIK